MKSHIRLRSYKLTHDSGFAPNPYEETLSLATCKPGIRQVAQKGEWVAGFTSKRLLNVPIGQEKLIYLMQVSERLEFDEYYRQYPQKRQENRVCGDNIYRLINEEYEQIENKYHKKGEYTRDISSKYVLLANIFYYFGKDSVAIPDAYRPRVPKGPARYGVITEDEQAQYFIDWVKAYAAEKYDGKNGLLGAPHEDCQPENSDLLPKLVRGCHGICG